MESYGETRKDKEFDFVPREITVMNDYSWGLRSVRKKANTWKVREREWKCLGSINFMFQ